MQIQVTDTALALFAAEWGFRKGDEVRIFARYSGGGNDAYAFGMTRSTPVDPALTTTAGGMTFFVEQGDVWYLDGNDLVLDAKAGEIVFSRGK